MKIALFLLLPLFLYSDTLKELIIFATLHNDLVLSKKYSEQSKTKELESKKSAYFPTVDMGGFYKKDDKASPFQAGDTLSGFTQVQYDIYDGGKKSSQVESAKYALSSSFHDKQAYKKSLALQITEDFFNIKNLQASLYAREEAQKSLQAQLTRMTSFYNAQMATRDDVERIQADFDTNIYNMESIKFQIISLKSMLELKVGKSIGSLENASFHKHIAREYAMLESTKALIAQNNSIKSTTKALESIYYPNIRIEDKYSLYKFGREDPLVTFLNKQNTLLVTLNFRVFDYGAVSKAKEAILLQTQALNSHINYQTKEQKVQYNLAKARIKTANARIKSAKSALRASSSAFITIEKKYNAGIVDYIVYLETLTKRTNAKALYESSLNDLELAYATLYFYEAKDIKEELK